MKIYQFHFPHVNNTYRFKMPIGSKVLQFIFVNNNPTLFILADENAAIMEQTFHYVKPNEAVSESWTKRYIGSTITDHGVYFLFSENIDL